MKNTKKKLLTVLFIILNIAIVAYIAFSEFGDGVNADEMPHLKANWGLYLIGAFVCLIVFFGAETVKYAYMMHILGQEVSWRTAFETAALGKYYDSITPSGIGGQPFQIYWLHKHGYSDGSSTVMPVMGFITMQAGFILMALTIFLTWRSVELESIRYTAYLGLFTYSIIPVIIIAFAIKPQAVEKMVSSVIRLATRMHIVKKPEETTESVVGELWNFHRSFKVVSQERGAILILLVLSLIYQAALCSVSYFVIIALGGSDTYLHILATTVYVYATVTMIATPGNSGAAEGVFYIAFSKIGSEGVFWAMLIWRLLTYYSFIAIGGLVYGAGALTARLGRKKDDE